MQETREALEQARTATTLGIPHEMLLLDLYAALRPVDGITGATTADDIQDWDSANHINIVVAIEQHFGVRKRRQIREGFPDPALAPPTPSTAVPQNVAT